MKLPPLALVIVGHYFLFILFIGTEALFDIGTLLTSGIKVSMVIEGDAVPREFIPKLISLHERGMFPFDELVKTYDFKDINQAFADSESGITIKPIIVY